MAEFKPVHRLMINDLARTLRVDIKEEDQSPTKDEYWPYFIIGWTGVELHAPNPDTDHKWMVGQTVEFGGRSYFDPPDAEFQEHSMHEECWQAILAAGSLHTTVFLEGALESYQWGFEDWFKENVIEPIEYIAKYFNEELMVA